MLIRDNCDTLINISVTQNHDLTKNRGLSDENQFLKTVKEFLTEDVIRLEKRCPLRRPRVMNGGNKLPDDKGFGHVLLSL